jgi:hypothetical protein
MKRRTLSTLLLAILISTTTLSNHINYDDVVTHFYYIKRLAKSAYCLSLLHKQHYCYRPCNIIKQKECIHIDSISFFHHKIISCIDTMLLSGSLKALLLLLHDMKHYQYLQDQQFVHELFLLIFTVHKQILLHECDEDTAHSLKTITLNTILEISEKINQLPIAEILNAIDMLVTELPPFLEKYEFHSKITWKDWLKKYWWVPPVFGAWFGLKILLRLQRPQFYFTPYSPSPKPILSLPLIETNDPALLEIRD